jgi:hypothetical protein
MTRKLLALLLAVICAVLLGGQVGGKVPSTIEPVPPSEFTPYVLRSDPPQSPTPARFGPRRAEPHETEHPVVSPTSRPRPSLAGEASWYCLAGVSRCTVGHPSGLYAAIRRDLLEHRGDRARVCLADGSRCVDVTVIDCLCSGGPGVIDLYADAFRQLAPLSAGRVKVAITWIV